MIESWCIPTISSFILKPWKTTKSYEGVSTANDYPFHVKYSKYSISLDRIEFVGYNISDWIEVS